MRLLNSQESSNLHWLSILLGDLLKYQSNYHLAYTR
ncbi:hypothetical protein [Aquimarina sp. MAR_2010_214]